jgi:hypothetical protein
MDFSQHAWEHVGPHEVGQGGVHCSAISQDGASVVLPLVPVSCANGSLPEGCAGIQHEKSQSGLHCSWHRSSQIDPSGKIR